MTLGVLMKQLILSIALFTLTGCQLTELVKDPGAIETQLKKQHALAALAINEELDLFFSDQGRQHLFHELAHSLKKPTHNKIVNQDSVTKTRWTASIDDTTLQAFQLQRVGQENIKTNFELMFLDIPVISKNKISLFQAPSPDSAPMGQIAKNELVKVLALELNEEWALIERDNQLIGYAKYADFENTIKKRDFLNSRPYELKVTYENDLTRDGYVLPIHHIFGLAQCRIVKLQFKRQAIQQQRTINLCQKTPDVWFIDPHHDSATTAN